jgi:ribosomal protein S26
MRAERRHHKDRKIAAQLRIIEQTYAVPYLGDRDGRILDAHINCGCWGRKLRNRAEDRRRERLAWQAEDVAY